MRLIFTKNGEQTVVPREQSALRLARITGGSAMILDSMKGGIPVKFDGGEYTLVNDNLTPIGINNFF